MNRRAFIINGVLASVGALFGIRRGEQKQASFVSVGKTTVIMPGGQVGLVCRDGAWVIVGHEGEVLESEHIAWNDRCECGEPVMEQCQGMAAYRCTTCRRVIITWEEIASTEPWESVG